MNTLSRLARAPDGTPGSSAPAARTAPTTEVGFGERLAYGVGDLASGMVMFTAVSTLMFYYTEVAGLTAAVVGTLLFAVRAWDAVWDVLVGVMVDRTRTRWGSCRPYILFGSLLGAASWVACFSIATLPQELRLPAAVLSYTALMMAFSMVNVPYSAMPTLMTAEPAGRLRLAGARAFFAMLSGSIVSAVFLPLVKTLGETPTQGYTRAVVVLALFCLTLHLVCFAFTRERIAIPPRSEQKSVWVDVKHLAGTAVWWQILAMTVVTLTAHMLPVGAALYYYRYVVGSAGASALFFMSLGAGAVVGVLISDRVTRRVCKRRVALAAKFLGGLVWLGFYFVPADPVLPGYAIAFTASMIGAIALPVMWSVPADIADHVELRTGRRLAGLAASTIAFSAKMGIGLSSLVAGWVLAGAGYQANAAQTPESLHAMWLLMSLIPAAGYMLSALFILRAPIGRDELADLAARLKRRREPAPAA